MENFSGLIGMSANEPLQLADLRQKRKSELEQRLAMNPGDQQASALYKILTGEMHDDPYTGDVPHQQTADIYASQGQGFKNPADQRMHEEANKIAQLGESARVAGEYGIERERIAQAGNVAAAEAQARGMLGKGSGSGNTPALSAGLAERVAGAQTSLGILDRMQKSFKPEYVGPAQGRYNEFLQKVPLIPTDPGFNSFSADSSTLTNSVIKAITGAQMSEQEAVRLLRQIPTPHDKSEVWAAKVNSLRSNLNDTITNIRNVNTSQPVPEDRLRQLAQEMGLQF